MGAFNMLTVCLRGALVFGLGLSSRQTFDRGSEGVDPHLPQSSNVSVDPGGKALFINPYAPHAAELSSPAVFGRQSQMFFSS